MKKTFNTGQIVSIIANKVFCPLEEIDDICSFMNNNHVCLYCYENGITKYYSKYILAKFENLKTIPVISKSEWTVTSAKEYIDFLSLNYGNQFELDDQWFDKKFSFSWENCKEEYFKLNPNE